jgi:hypothetical protein
MNLSHTFNEKAGEYEVEIPRIIAPHCKQLVELWDDPKLRKAKDDDKIYQLFVNIVQWNGSEIQPWQNDTLQYILSNAESITKRLELFLCYLSDQEMKGILDDSVNAAIVAELALNGTDAYRKLFSVCGLSILDHPHKEMALYTIEMSYACDEEHMLSVLMHGDKLISHGGITDFRFRGNGLLEHAASSSVLYGSAYDKIV